MSSQEVRELLELFGWADVEAARRFRVTTRTVANWKTGGIRSGPALRLAEVFLAFPEAAVRTPLPDSETSS